MMAACGCHFFIKNKTVRIVFTSEMRRQNHHLPEVFYFQFRQERIGKQNEEKKATSLIQVACSNIDTFKAFFHAMLDEGIYLAPSVFKVGLVSAPRNEETLHKTLAAADKAFAKLR